MEFKMQMQADFEKLLLLLKNFASNDFAKTALADFIVSKAFEDGHLYSDMGLDSRVTLNKLMGENYPDLANKRPPDKRWKKFLFDEIDSVAPACYGCKDTGNCFKCDVLEHAIAN
jgi:nitrogen fixation protein NifQ